MKYLLILFILVSFPIASGIASESYINRNRIEYSTKEDQKPVKKFKIKKNIKQISEKLKNKLKTYIQKKIHKFLDGKSDFEILLWAISGLIAIIGGLIFLGASAWLIIGIILGFIFFIAFVSYLFVRYLENGFSLEWYWWPILLLLLAGAVAGVIFFVGINPVSSIILAYLLYIVLGFVVVILFIWMIIAFFKALFRPFRR